MREILKSAAHRPIMLYRAKKRDHMIRRGRIRVPDEITFEDQVSARLSTTLLEGSLSTIRAFAALVDEKDPCSRGHSLRVSHLSASFARFLQLEAAEVRDIWIAGTFHDVGKIAVPPTILSKSMPLTEWERGIIMGHPEVGAALVERTTNLNSAVAGIRSHHERWDGAGYPRGLSGEQIPLSARIIALADTYDAITSDRPYRSAMLPQAALDEIALHAGRQFDPNLVQMFFLMMASRYTSRLTA